MNWEVQLVGDKADLSSLAECLATGEVRIVERGDNHFLTADRFESLDDAGQVRAEADRLVQALSGSAALVLGAHGGIRPRALQRQIRRG